MTLQATSLPIVGRFPPLLELDGHLHSHLLFSISSLADAVAQLLPAAVIKKAPPSPTAVTSNVVGNLKVAVVVLVSWMIFRNPISALNAEGYFREYKLTFC
ncbi:hypothetical protein LINPERPRIM_LOCUS13043 [Linum perenne]